MEVVRIEYIKLVEFHGAKMVDGRKPIEELHREIREFVMREIRFWSDPR